jgi:hypothetical protein
MHPVQIRFSPSAILGERVGEARREGEGERKGARKNGRGPLASPTLALLPKIAPIFSSKGECFHSMS